jgi:hypothetical protein
MAGSALKPKSMETQTSFVEVYVKTEKGFKVTDVASLRGRFLKNESRRSSKFEPSLTYVSRVF